jgi:hypothetical protein
MVAKVPPGKSAKPRGRPKKLKTRPPKNVFLRTDAEKMAAAALLHAEGSSIRDIAAVTGLTKGMVQHRLCSPERPPAQRESVPSPEIKKRRDLVKKLHKKNKRSTSSDIAMELSKEGIHISKRTAARDQNALGGRHLTCERVQKLSDVQKAKRLEWAKALLKQYPEGHEFWRKIVFSDESYRGCTDMDATQWVFPGESRGLKQETRWDFKVHCWAYIGTGGVRSIHLVEGMVTGASYLKLLKSTIGRREWRRIRWWQQDNARPHTEKTVAAWLDKNVQCLAGWPANSPDLSPIENLWGKMWSDALRQHPTSKQALWNEVQSVFLGFDEAYIEKLIMSFRRRLVLCVERDGGSISDAY